MLEKVVAEHDLVMEFGKPPVIPDVVDDNKRDQWMARKVEIKDGCVLIRCERVVRERHMVLMRIIMEIFRILEFLSAPYYIRGLFVRHISRHAAAQFIDLYLLTWFCVEVLLYAYNTSISSWLIMSLAIYRLIEIIQVYGNVLVFHRLRHDPSLGPFTIISYSRSLIIGVLSYIEIAVLYGLLFFVLRSNLTGNMVSVFDAFYYSVVTITTLGYGDIAPQGLARLVAASEAVLGVLFGIMLLGRFLALLPEVRALIDDRRSDI